MLYLNKTFTTDGRTIFKRSDASRSPRLNHTDCEGKCPLLRRAELSRFFSRRICDGRHKFIAFFGIYSDFSQLIKALLTYYCYKNKFQAVNLSIV
jgi:hypothetical protein